MYEAYFGLRQRPFRPTPDRGAYYPATSHESVLGQLRRAIDDGEGLALLTGDPGTGKTLLCHCLMETEQTTAAFLTNSHFPDRSALLQAMLFDLALAHDRGSEQQLRLALTDHLLKDLSRGTRTLVVIDEAQHLTPDLLEELRLLGNVESGERKALQVVLAAQPGFEKMLALSDLAAFRQRLTTRCRLEPLGRHESADYLASLLRIAGGRADRIFTDEALDLLARASGGVPRLLNQAAHLSLVLAFQTHSKVADAEVVFETCARLDLPVDDPPQDPELSVMTASGGDEADEPDEDEDSSGIFVPPGQPA